MDGSCGGGAHAGLMEGATSQLAGPDSGYMGAYHRWVRQHSLTATVRTLPSIAGLQAYGVGETSDICTYCGASPQDVRHLFACTTHQTELSPEDLWRNPVGSIRAFNYLDNGNLDRLDDGPGRGKQ